MGSLRINKVEKARKHQGKCRGCGKVINKGDGYQWVKSRYGPRVVKCRSCSFRGSELESNETLSQLYAEVESVSDQLVGPADYDRLEEMRDELVSAIETARDAFQEKADNLSEHFPDSERVSELEDKVSELETWLDSVNEVEIEFDPETAEEARETFADRVWGELHEKAGGCPI